jgi:hypothetical protein
MPLVRFVLVPNEMALVPKGTFWDEVVLQARKRDPSFLENVIYFTRFKDVEYELACLPLEFK